MRTLRAWALRALGLFTRRRSERELVAELESDFEMRVDDNIRAGMSPAEARRHARRDVGNIEAAKEACREVSRVAFLESALRDTRHALRGMRRYPLFSLVIVLSLGIAFGSCAAILDLGYNLFLRAVPIERPSRVVVFYSTFPNSSEGAPLAFMNWRDVRAESRSLADVAGYEWASLPVALDSRTTHVPAQLVSGNYFELLGVPAVLGRTFSEEADAIPGAPLEVVVSHHFFQQSLGADASRLGESLRIEGQPFTIVGVAAPEFKGVEVGLPVELWIPFGVYRQIYPESIWPWYEARRGLIVYGLGRLAAGVPRISMPGDWPSSRVALSARTNSVTRRDRVSRS